MEITAFALGQRFVGLREVAGLTSNPHILAMLKLDNEWVEDDSVPWCSAWVNYIAWLLRLPRSKSLAARSWLRVGVPIELHEARPEFDVVILTRAGATKDPGVIAAPGHVAFFAGRHTGAAGRDDARVLLLGGNQGDAVSIAPFRYEDVIGVRRLA